MAEVFEIGIVGQSIWEPFVERALQGLNASERQWTIAILTALHNRHVGITPFLARGFAQLLANAQPHPELAASPWGEVFTRLARAARESSETSSVRRRTQGAGLFLHRHPSYAVLRILLPLVHHACRTEVGTCLLFAEGDTEDDTNAEEYATYEAELTDGIAMLARDPKCVPLLWQELGLTLLGLSQHENAASRLGAAPPELDAAGLGMLLHLEPAALPLDERVRALQRLPLPQRRRVSRRLREGGYSGVYVSRRLEDIDHMLLSELQQPRALVADRILNTGYLALERQPKRQKLRDLLLIAFLPFAPSGATAAGFLKACWFHAVLRLSLVLREQRLTDTEFRWVEQDEHGRERTTAVRLSDLPEVVLAQAAIPTPAYVRTFLNALGWLPAYLDTRTAATSVKLNAVARADDDCADAAVRWGCAAWRSQENLPAGLALKSDDFALIHAMLCIRGQMPADERPDGLDVLAQLRGGLQFGDAVDRHASITWQPALVTEIAAWRYTARGGSESVLFRPGEILGAANGPVESDLAGRLVRRWVGQWIMEIWRA